MTPQNIRKENVYSTPWFRLVSKDCSEWDAPHYAIETDDYVSILAVSDAGRVPLVRQYRPAVECETLELPSGHVDPGETPEAAAHRELKEETGYAAGEMTLLGALLPDTGRMGNRQWCFFAAGAVRTGMEPEEEGLTPADCSVPELFELVQGGQLSHALHLAVILLAIQQNKLPCPTL